MRKRLQIANCKLQIANCRTGIGGRLGQGLPSAELPRPARTAASPRWLVFPICNLQFAICNLQSLVLLLFGSLAFAAAPPPSTDDQLRESLNSKAGDDYDRALLGDPAKPEGKGQVDENLQKKLQRELGPAARREDKPADPLRKIAEDMSKIPPRLDQRDSGVVTQHMQGQIVSDLQKLIELAKKSGCCKNCKGGKPGGGGDKKPAQSSGQPSGNSPAPVQASDPKIRTPEEIAAEEAKKKAREWMKEEWFKTGLQTHTPQEMLDSGPSEYFLPEYELEIEDYFRRLSEDHPELGRP